MTAPDWLARQARLRPDHPALVDDAVTLSWRALDAGVARLAAGLRAMGVAGATRVGVRLPNGRLLVELIHAVPRTGAALVLLDPRLPVEEARRQAAQARVAFTIDDDAPRPDGTPDAEPVLDLATPHTVLFTSGTSGRPKAVVLTAANHLASALASAAHLGHHDDDRWLACLPLTHVGGLAIVLRAAILGATVVLHPRFDADRAAHALARDDITLASLVPTTLARVVAGTGARPAALRCVLVGGAGADPDLLERAAHAGLPATPTYGLTEAASQVATALPGGRTLHPLVATRVRVVDDEIQVRGPTVSAGTAGPDGWLRTGDRGRLAGDGSLVVLGRRDDLIVTGGENVDPAAVEAALRRHPAVVDAAVAAVADAEWGQVVGAWVVARAGDAPTLAELRAACGGSLAAHQLPRRLTLVDALPRTASGKLRRGALRAAPG